MAINPAIFRAYDIRGDSRKDLSPELAYKIGFCFSEILAKSLNKNTRELVIYVGMDGRLSSKELANALVQGLQATGAKVNLLGLVPTPCLYYADHVFKVCGSVMVTGSHNPKHDNGFKIVAANSPFFGAQIQELKNLILAHDWGQITIDPKCKAQNIDISQQYLNRVLSQRNISQKLKIAFDPANGATCNLVKMLSRMLPCEVVTINDQIDGNFPAHPPDPTIAENMEQLANFVVTNNCDFGIGFDGDGDRIAIITSKGRMLFADHLLYLFALDVLSQHPQGTFIMDVKTSQWVFDFIAKQGGKPLIWKTGHSFIKAKIKETGAVFAGEMSGHIFFADQYFGYDDGIYSAIRFMEIASKSNKTTDEMLETLPKFFSTPEIKIPTPDEKKFEVINKVRDYAQNNGLDFIDIDGVRVKNKHGWWLVRASNTGPNLIARCESDSEEGLQNLLKELNQAICTP